MSEEELKQRYPDLYAQWWMAMTGQDPLQAVFTPFAQWLQNTGADISPKQGMSADQLNVANAAQQWSTGQMVNPATGSLENLYQWAAPNAPMLGGDGGMAPYVDPSALRYYFQSDPNRPANSSPYNTGGYSSDNSGTFDHFLERATLGGLAAIPAAAALAPAAAAGGIGGGPLMPPAIPAADPTFGGALTQTAPGVWGPAVGAAAAAGGTGAAGTAAAAGAGGVGATKVGDILSGDVGVGDIAKNLTLSDLARTVGTIGGTGLSILGSQQQAEALERIAKDAAARENLRYEDLTKREQARYEDVAKRELERYNDIVARDSARYGDLKSREDAAIARQRGDIQFGREVGAPSRTRYEETFAPGFDVASLPGLKGAIDTSTESLLRKASLGGNPVGNPGAMAEILKYVTDSVALPELNRYRTINANTGGYGSYAGAGASVPGIGTSLSPGVAGTGSIYPGNSAAGSNVGTAGGQNAAISAVGKEGDIYSDIGRGISNVLNPPTSLEEIFKKMKGSGMSLSLT